MIQRNDGLGGVELTHVTKRFVTPTGAAMTAIRDVNLVVEPGQFCAVVGPTGCGKSTTLTLVAGTGAAERRDGEALGQAGRRHHQRRQLRPFRPMLCCRGNPWSTTSRWDRFSRA